MAWNFGLAEDRVRAEANLARVRDFRPIPPYIWKQENLRRVEQFLLATLANPATGLARQVIHFLVEEITGVQIRRRTKST